MSAAAELAAAVVAVKAELRRQAKETTGFYLDVDDDSALVDIEGVVDVRSLAMAALAGRKEPGE